MTDYVGTNTTHPKYSLGNVEIGEKAQYKELIGSLNCFELLHGKIFKEVSKKNLIFTNILIRRHCIKPTKYA